MADNICHNMKRIDLSTDQTEWMEALGLRIKAARLKRNLTQNDVADRAGIGRLAYIALEKGHAGSSLATLIRVIGVFGYNDPLKDILLVDPIGEDLLEFHGRKRAWRDNGLADF